VLPFTNGQSITLLPSVRFSLPLLLAFLSFWLAYRVVNYPAFADFLIATEAELNKVSWTTRKRLIQDTIVVLVTVVLLTVFLFVVDQIWAWILTQIGVIQIAPPSGGPGGAKVPY
jgi:preprotein translocase subunit SecE